MVVCGCAPSVPRGPVTGRKASSVLSSTVPALPECPYAFPKMSSDRSNIVLRIARVRLGMPVAIQGPYTPEILDWIANNGRRTENGSTVFRQDSVDEWMAKRLKKDIAIGREVFYYEWFDSAEGGMALGGQSGFIIIDHDVVVNVLVLMTV